MARAIAGTSARGRSKVIQSAPSARTRRMSLATSATEPWNAARPPPFGVSVSSSMAILEKGAGAPLHLHETVDEVIVVIEGTLDVRMGEERVLVGANQTIAIPARTPHAFTVVSPEGARFIAFLPKQGAHMATRYLEGGPPLGANLK